jgi:hypothetical protein
LEATLREALAIGPDGVGCELDAPDPPVLDDLEAPQPDSTTEAAAARVVCIAWRRVTGGRKSRGTLFFFIDTDFTAHSGENRRREMAAVPRGTYSKNEVECFTWNSSKGRVF